MDNIFEDLNFQIDTDWKLGFIGRNGREKTTFFNLLLGKFEYSGKIISSVDFNYFPFSVKDKSKYTHEILEEICPQAEDWEFLREIAYLNVDAEAMYRTFETYRTVNKQKYYLPLYF